MTLSIDPRTITTPEEYEAWHQQNMERLRLTHQERMEAWERFKTPEYLHKVQQTIIEAAHAAESPPWEDD